MSFELIRDMVIKQFPGGTLDKVKLSRAFEVACENMAVITFTRDEIEENAKREPGEITDDAWRGIKDVIEDTLGDLDATVSIVDAGLAIEKDDHDDDYDEIAGTMFEDQDPPESL